MYDANLKGKLMFANLEGVNLRKGQGTNTPILKTFKKGALIGTSDGYHITWSGIRWIGCVLFPAINGAKYGYVAEKSAGQTLINFQNDVKPDDSKETAQTLVNAIVSNDKKTYAAILRLIAKNEQLKKQNIKITPHLLQSFIALCSSLRSRQEKLKNTPNLQHQTSNAAMSDMQKRHDSLVMHSNNQVNYFNGLGVIPIIVWLIVAVVVMAAGAAIYVSLQPDYNDSIADLDRSKLLEKALKSLTPAEREELLEDLEKQIDDAANAGARNQWWKDIFKTWMIIPIVAAAGYVGVTAWQKYKSKKAKQ